MTDSIFNSGDKVTIRAKYNAEYNEIYPLPLGLLEIVYLEENNQVVEIPATIVRYDDFDSTYYVKVTDSRAVETIFWVNSKFVYSGEFKKINRERTNFSCAECRNGFEYAEPNFQGDKFVCWSCCDSNRWKYQRVNGIIIKRK